MARELISQSRTIERMKNAIITTASSEDYFPVLRMMLSSVLPRARQGGVDVGVLDLGLNPQQITLLQSQGVIVVDPGHDYGLSLFEEPPPDFFKSMTARPHLPRHFPGAEIYMWMDADCWVQQWSAVGDYLKYAKQSGFVATAEWDRAYSPFGMGKSMLDFAVRHFSDIVDPEQARLLAQFPMINSGAFAARVDAPHWRQWSDVLHTALRRLRRASFFVEQTALNVVIRSKGISTTFLPATYNWACHRALPIVGADGVTFLEPQPPFSPIGILHLTANTKHAVLGWKTSEGVFQQRPLTYPGPMLF
jgi:hypothetical protein